MRPIHVRSWLAVASKSILKTSVRTLASAEKSRDEISKKMTLYCLEPSPPNRAVFLCLEALGLSPERKFVDLFSNEQRSPEYSKINPQQTVPALVDDGFAIWDSHAINAYLVSKYGKDDSLYPKDLQKRALVDQRLHFDSGILFPRLRIISFPILFLRRTEIPDEKRQRVLEAYDFLEKFLEGRDFVAGDNFTIADFSCVATASTLVEAMRIPADNHPRMKAWLQRCKDTLPGYSRAQDQGLAIITQAIASQLGFE